MAKKCIHGGTGAARRVRRVRRVRWARAGKSVTMAEMCAQEPKLDTRWAVNRGGGGKADGPLHYAGRRLHEREGVGAGRGRARQKRLTGLWPEKQPRHRDQKGNHWRCAGAAGPFGGGEGASLEKGRARLRCVLCVLQCSL